MIPPRDVQVFWWFFLYSVPIAIGIDTEYHPFGMVAASIRTIAERRSLSEAEMSRNTKQNPNLSFWRSETTEESLFQKQVQGTSFKFKTQDSSLHSEWQRTVFATIGGIFVLNGIQRIIDEMLKQVQHDVDLSQHQFLYQFLAQFLIDHFNDLGFAQT